MSCLHVHDVKTHNCEFVKVGQVRDSNTRPYLVTVQSVSQMTSWDENVLQHVLTTFYMIRSHTLLITL